MNFVCILGQIVCNYSPVLLFGMCSTCVRLSLIGVGDTIVCTSHKGLPLAHHVAKNSNVPDSSKNMSLCDSSQMIYGLLLLLCCVDYIAHMYYRSPKKCIYIRLCILTKNARLYGLTRVCTLI